MIDHVSTYATDFDKTVAFYDAALGALGYARNVNMVTSWDPEWPDCRIAAYGPGAKAVFWIAEVKVAASPRHFAFSAADRGAVKAFYDAGLDAGGNDNGPPGERPVYHPGYYGAFLFDPDGNNVEAVNHG